MKTLKLIATLLICMTALHHANAQDSVKILKPVFWSADINFGIKSQGTYGGAMLRFYREKSFIALGASGFSYVPASIPSNFYPGLNIVTGHYRDINSNVLCLIGYGRFIPSAHETFRVLFQADAAFGKYREAVNFRRNNFDDLGLFAFLAVPFSSNYKYDIREGFTGGLHLLAKAEVCSRFASLGVNLETFLTTKTTAFCAGVSVGFGKLRKRNN